MEHFTIFHFFSLAAGLSIFLFGMQLGENNLRSFPSSRIRRLITIITRHRLLSFSSGLILTVLTQSSSATTVLLVSLAGANLLTLHQSLGMILGSGLGTTLTVQLYAFNFQELAPLLIAAGFFLSLRPRTTRAHLCGKLILGFGFVFFGMKLMSDSVVGIRTLPAARSIIQNSLAHPILGLSVGTFFTAVVQSSAATLAILIALTASFSPDNIPPLASFFPLILGVNLGTCATALLSMLRANTEGHRVAWTHFLFKLVGILIVLPFTDILSALITRFSLALPLQIALAHTVFNLIVALLFLPFLGKISFIIKKLIRSDSHETEDFKLHFIKPGSSAFPATTLIQASKEIGHMASVVGSIVTKGEQLIEAYSPQLREKIEKLDDEVDFLHSKIIEYLTGLVQSELTTEDSRRSYELLMVTTDLEHIGDIVSKSIVVFAQKINDSTIPMPSSEKENLKRFYDKAIYLFSQTIEAFCKNDLNGASKIIAERNAFYERFESCCKHHFERLYHHHDPSLHQTAIFVDLMEEINRINDFTFRISAHMLGVGKAGYPETSLRVSKKYSEAVLQYGPNPDKDR